MPGGCGWRAGIHKGGAMHAKPIKGHARGGLRDANLARLVDLGPPLQQQPHHRPVAVRGRHDEARPTLLPQCVRARARVVSAREIVAAFTTA